MVTTTILTSAPDISNVRADSYDKLAGYAAFRRIQDDFEEAPRPSLDDVVSVAAVLRAALASSFGQDSVEFTGSEPLAPVMHRRDKVKHVSYTDDWAVRNGLEGAGQVASGTHEGRTHQLILSPGTLRLTSFDARARAATEERALRVRAALAGSLSRFCVLTDCPLFAAAPQGDGGSGAEVVEWSRKSRARMVEALAALDYSGWLSTSGTLAMLTLTLPGNWETLVPSGADFKGYVRTFQKRWTRSRSAPLVRSDWVDDLGGLRSKWSVDPAARLDWTCLWKLEFQGAGRLRSGDVRAAGAPHWHGLVRLPVFVYSSGGYKPQLGYEVQEMVHDYVSRTWADVVDASKDVDGLDKWGNDTSEYLRHLSAGTGIDFSGKDFSDPRRISMYFLGHSAKSTDGKEYQHKVPALWQEPGKGPGRFWGYCGLNKALARVTVTDADLVRLKRIARKVKTARDWRVNVLRQQGAALKSGAAVPSAFAVNVKTRGRRPVKGEIAVKRGTLVPKHLEPMYTNGSGRTAHRKRNFRAWLAATSDENLGKPLDALYVYKPRTVYAPFSKGQGGFVLVNDALQLGLDIARALGRH